MALVPWLTVEAVARQVRSPCLQASVQMMVRARGVAEGDAPEGATLEDVG